MKHYLLVYYRNEHNTAKCDSCSICGVELDVTNTVACVNIIYELNVSANANRDGVMG